MCTCITSSHYFRGFCQHSLFAEVGIFFSFTCSITPSRISCRIMRCNFSTCSISLCLKHSNSRSLALSLSFCLTYSKNRVAFTYILFGLLFSLFILYVFCFSLYLFCFLLSFFNSIFNCLCTTQEKRKHRKASLFSVCLLLN